MLQPGIILRTGAGKIICREGGQLRRGEPAGQAAAADFFRRQLRQKIRLVIGGCAAGGIQAHFDHPRRAPAFIAK